VFRTAKWSPALSLLIALCGSAAHAQSVGSVINAVSCLQADVNAVINGPVHTAVDRDVIQIPAGSCIWTSGITVPSGIGITIIGSGTPNSSPGTSGPGTINTTIIDNVGGNALITARPTFGNSTTRISSLNLQPASGANLGVPIVLAGTCTSSGCPSIRVDNLTFPSSWVSAHLSDANVVIAANVFGVLDHNSITGSSAASPLGLVNVNHAAWQGIGQYGDNSWASPDTFGTAQALYIENNTFSYGFADDTDGGDTYQDTGGGRFVCRYNTFNNISEFGACEDHGTESTGRPRGGRQIEAYGNSFICTNTAQGCAGVGLRSGVAYVFNNNYSAQSTSWFSGYAVLDYYRSFAYFNTWNGCDGTDTYDANEGVTYYSGTYTGSSGSTAFTDGNQTWTATFGSSSWASTAASSGTPYFVHNVTQNFGAEIASASGNSLIFANTPICNWGTQANCTWTNGDSYQVRRARACIDQPSRSGGTLLSGTTPSPTGNNGQTLDPSYEWGDTHTGNLNGSLIQCDTNLLINNRDFYYQASSSAQTSPTSPFNGSQGTGFGTLANRPTTCTPRVGYWATDQGSWNQSGSGGQGELFICTAANTWTLSYTPYIYPHPITAGASTGTIPNPPTNLAVTVQ
jgi:hypothetical protein